MREYLFRGKCLDDGEWVYGYYVKQLNANEIYCLDDCEFERRHVDPSTVGQYTGLKDKVGNKIFEGDIVQTPKYGVENGRGQNYSGKDKFSVWYADGTFTLENKLRLFCLRPDTNVEILGNRWDNPELLEEAGGDA